VPAVQQTIDDAAREAGRNPLAIRRGYNLMGAILQPGSHAIRASRKGVIVGTAKQWVDEILRYYSELKMDSFFFWPVMGDEEVQARIFVEEIVPEVMAGIAGDRS